VREPEIRLEEERPAAPLSTRALATRGIAAGLLMFLVGALATASLTGLKGLRATPPRPFDLPGALAGLAVPASAADVVRLAGLLLLGAAGGVFTAAILAARRAARAGG
jgi:hypothetical protein